MISITGTAYLKPAICESKAPPARYHLLTNPDSGGMPTSARPPNVKHHIVTGIVRPMPLSCATLRLPVL